MRRRPLQFGVAALLFAVCLATYSATLAPSITWKHDGVDSGDLVTAAYTLGIAHPPGYPLFTLLAKLATLLPFGEIAHRVNLMSAVLASSTVIVIYCTILLLRPQRMQTDSMLIIAAATVLLLGFSRTFWSQAIIAEVYALNAFLLAVTILLVTLYRRRRDRRWLWMLGLVMGLALTNHLSALMFLPGTLFLVLRQGRPRPATWLVTAVSFLIGLSTYAYLPLASAQNPPVNWGAPHTWSGFWWTVSGRIYREYFFGLPVAYLPARIASWLKELSQQFTWLGFSLGLVGIWDLWEKDRDWLWFSLVSFGAVVVYSLAYNTTDSYLYLIPTYLLFTVWMARGASYLVREILQPWIGERRDRALSRSRLVGLISSVVLLLPILPLAANLAALDLSEDREAYDYALQVLSSTPSDAVIIADTDAHIFSLWYLRYVEATDPGEVVVAKGLFHYQWYRDTLSWHHPQIILPKTQAEPQAQLLAFIDDNLPHRPIFLTDPDDEILARYAHTQLGALYKLGVKG
jgi:hypothetical protein